jgi:hypothetical protein
MNFYQDRNLADRLILDYQKVYPILDIHKGNSILRCIDSLLLCICIGANLDSYYLTIGILPLTDASIQIDSLSISQRMVGGKYDVQEQITLQFHDRKYEEAIHRISRQFVIPLDIATLSLSDLLEAYEKFLATDKLLGQRPLFKEYEHILQYSTFYDDKEYSLLLLDKFCEKLSLKRPIQIQVMLDALKLKSLEEWREKQLLYINDPSIVVKNVEKNIKKFKLENCQNTKLIIDNKKTAFLNY